jgi:hypothetical protein
LNFGPLAAPLSYAAFGLFIGWFQRAIHRLRPGDARFLLVPMGVYMCIGMLLGDSDNTAFGLAKNGFMPLLVVAIGSVRVRYRDRSFSFCESRASNTEGKSARSWFVTDSF